MHWTIIRAETGTERRSSARISKVYLNVVPVMWVFADLPTMATRRSRGIKRPSGSSPWPFTGKPGRLGINRDTKLQTQFPVYWHSLQNVLVQHFVRPLVSRHSTRHLLLESCSINRNGVISIPYVLDSLFQAYLKSYFVCTVSILSTENGPELFSWFPATLYTIKIYVHLHKNRPI